MSPRIKCPECGCRDSKPVTVAVSADEYATQHAAEMETRKGVASADGRVEGAGRVVVDLEIDEDAYKTDNHFQRKRHLESAPHVVIFEPALGHVEVTFNVSRFTVSAHGCLDCDHVWTEVLGDLSDHKRTSEGGVFGVRDPEQMQPGEGDRLSEAEETALETMMEELSVLDVDRVDVDVVAGNGSHADIDGEYVQVDALSPTMMDPTISGVRALRQVLDVFWHEIEHIRSSDLTGKKSFSEAYPVAPKLAGFVCNVLEDQWVDAERVRRKSGMRRAAADRLATVMANDQAFPPMGALEGEQQFVNAFKQFAFAGYVKRPAAMIPEVKEMINEMDPIVDAVRTTPDQDTRESLMHDAMEIMLKYIERYDGEMPEPESGEGRGGAGGSGEGEDGSEGPDEEERGRDETSASEETIDKIEEEAEEQAGDVEGGTTVEGWDADELRADAEYGEGPDGDEADEDDAGSAGTGDEGADTPDTPDGDGEGVSDDPRTRVDDGDGGGRSNVARAGGDGYTDDTGDPTAHIETKYGVSDFEKTSDTDEKRFERFSKQVEKFEQPIEQLRREREQNRKRYVGSAMFTDSSEIRDEARNTTKQLVQELKDMLSRDAPEPAPEGGRINRRNMIRRMAGDRSEENLFEQQETNDTGDRVVGVATDLSGSMGGDIEKVKMTIGSLGEATQTVGDEFVATGVTDGKKEADETDENGIDYRLITGPNEQFQWRHLDAFTSYGNEPIAAGMHWTQDLMEQTGTNQKVMFVITDGKAHIDKNGDHDSHQAKQDIRDATNGYRAEGYTVVGIGFGGASHRYMKRCFGEDGFVMTTPEDLANDVMGIYKRQVDA